MSNLGTTRWMVLMGVALLCSGRAWAGPHDFVVYSASLGGNQEQARPYLDTFLRDIEKRMGWDKGSAAGEFLEDAKSAEDYIEKNKPGYGLISPTLYLDLVCRKVPVEPILSIVGITSTGPTERYHVVVKGDAIKDLKALKGKRLASNHLQNVKFVSRVVFDGKVDASSYFQLQPTVSPLKPFKQLDRGEADAILVNDTQLMSAKSLPIGPSLHVVYSSEALPPFPMVAFNNVVKPEEREKMRKTVLGMCSTPGGASVCKSLQITRFEPMDPNAFTKAREAYCKP
ncbi:MAG TPA: PhnD/SsuA/transferrin family substrate-binding protein [Polyangia bacterium]|nr:PhnD/SsuA/transferrin family substrate-binding protein [Polyangia bacterium]